MELDSLKLEIELERKKLEFDNSSFKNFIIQLLQALKAILKNILLFGKDKERNIVVN